MSKHPPFITTRTLHSLGNDNFPLRHGFFSRLGGTSKGLYNSLNTGPGSSDNPDHIAANRVLCAKALQGTATKTPELVSLYQIHSAHVITIDENTAPPLWRDSTPPKADGMVTRLPGIMLGILTADCMPFLFADADNGVIGAAHAGWRGALDGVLEATIEAMQTLGAEPEAIRFSLGPCLRKENFEVGMDLVDQFLAKYPSAEQFFAPGISPEKRQFDLAAFGFWRLREMGVLNGEDTKICTLANSDTYFSYRRSRREGAPDYGRNLSAILI